jgi:hypothetical protein
MSDRRLRAAASFPTAPLGYDIHGCDPQSIR